jgi:hypothetical protein
MKTKDIKVLKASIDMLTDIGLKTIEEAQLYLAVAVDNLGGELHGVMSYAAALNIPGSTISRTAFALVERGLLRYEQVDGDRRKRLVRATIPG